MRLNSGKLSTFLTFACLEVPKAIRSCYLRLGLALVRTLGNHQRGRMFGWEVARLEGIGPAC